MKKLIPTFVLFFLSMLALSCDEIAYATTNDISAEKTYIKGRIMQTLDKQSALVDIKTSEYRHSVVLIVSESDKAEYFDDKPITGNYVRIGTYSYTTTQNVKKTVPVYILESEYKPEKQNVYKYLYN